MEVCVACLKEDMSAQNFISLKHYFTSVQDKRVLFKFVGAVISKCLRLILVFLYSFLLNTFWLTLKCLQRLKENVKIRALDGNFDVAEQDDQMGCVTFPDLGSDESAKEQSSDFSFSFLRRDYVNSGGNIANSGENSGIMKIPVSSYSSNMSKYQFMSGKDVCGFIEDAETRGLVIQQNFVNSTDNLESNSPSDWIDDFHFEAESDDERAVEDFNESMEMKEEESLAENKNLSDEEEISDWENDAISYEVQLIPRTEFSARGLMLEDKSSIEKILASLDEMSPEISQSEFGSDPMIHDADKNPEIIERKSNSGVLTLDVDEEDDDDDYIEMEPYSLDCNNDVKEGMEEGQETDDEANGVERVSVERQTWESESDEEEDEFDILVEHQKLVNQMKNEVKNSKVKGLPTISEEEECAIPKVVEDLKPLKLEEKLGYKDRLQEIRKFYKSYAEKMWKLDILNYQSLQAMSFLQLKDSQLFMGTKKASAAFMKHLPLPNFLLFKERRVYADPTMKSINELHRDLEFVYVGQVCLSWEILRWQWGKVLQLLEHDPQDHHSYNQTASEYQQFQVLLQRFVEDEPFRGPRIQNYVQSRRFCRGLLQVPMIKDDHKEKKDKFKERDDSISVTILMEILKESIQVFWEFVRVDKDENTVTSKGFQGCLAHVQVLDDSELLMNLRASLEKKERKLKAITRSGNCIVKKFQKHPDDRPSSAMVMAQVELKLVSRVLSLSRLSHDQLLWCERKLNSINMVNKKIDIDPVFSLFPC